jgi:hypothetical protein
MRSPENPSLKKRTKSRVLSGIGIVVGTALFGSCIGAYAIRGYSESSEDFFSVQVTPAHITGKTCDSYSIHFTPDELDDEIARRGFPVTYEFRILESGNGKNVTLFNQTWKSEGFENANESPLNSNHSPRMSGLTIISMERRLWGLSLGRTVRRIYLACSPITP